MLPFFISRVKNAMSEVLDGLFSSWRMVFPPAFVDVTVAMSGKPWAIGRHERAIPIATAKNNFEFFNIPSKGRSDPPLN